MIYITKCNILRYREGDVMDKSTADRLLAAQERLYNDPEYSYLWKELQVKDRDYQLLMEELTPRQRAVIDDYMGLVWEIQRKMLCYAIEKNEL